MQRGKKTKIKKIWQGNDKITINTEPYIPPPVRALVLYINGPSVSAYKFAQHSIYGKFTVNPRCSTIIVYIRFPVVPSSRRQTRRYYTTITIII